MAYSSLVSSHAPGISYGVREAQVRLKPPSVLVWCLESNSGGYDVTKKDYIKFARLFNEVMDGLEPEPFYQR